VTHLHCFATRHVGRKVRSRCTDSGAADSLAQQSAAAGLLPKGAVAPAYTDHPTVGVLADADPCLLELAKTTAALLGECGLRSKVEIVTAESFDSHHVGCTTRACAVWPHGACSPIGRSAPPGTSLQTAVELCPSGKRAGQLRDLVGIAQLANLTLQLLDALRLAVVTPSRWPVSRSCWRTQRRSVSAVQPILAAIDSIAAHCESCWPWASTTMRTARSWTSGENSTDFFVAPPSKRLEPPQIPGRFTPSGPASGWLVTTLSNLYLHCPVAAAGTAPASPERHPRAHRFHASARLARRRLPGRRRPCSTAGRPGWPPRI